MEGHATSGFGVCVRNEGCEDLQLRKLYQILPDETATNSGFLRVVDDSGEDYLYPADNFIPVSLPTSVEQALAAIPSDVTSR
ncbi:MAG TPA: hypothetical protein VG477_00465 [Thermoanaerobaculia bacterium]|nr:hypothetical protein [Thermoanaerobaculia bacterium]